MRSDYALYVIAIICFIIAVSTNAQRPTGVTELHIYTLAVVGIVFVGLGYMARPKKAGLSETMSATLSPPKPRPVQATQRKTETKEEPQEPSPKKRTRKKRTTRKRKKKT